jgi:segregation and condensation protein B
MQTLLERGLVEQTGRAEVVGRPALYATTALFLEYFGLRGLEDMPAADELRRIPVQKPEQLLTADPGLATAPPDQLTLDEVEGKKAAGAPESDAGASDLAPDKPS